MKDETFARHVLLPLSTSLAHHVQVLEGVSDASTTRSASSKRRLHPGRRVGSVMVDFLDLAEGQRNFLEIAKRSGTDKVQGNVRLEGCLKNPESCTRQGCAKEACRPWGHFYNTMYQKRLGPYSTPETEPFQFLEIGFFNGNGYDTYKEFMPAAEANSMEISCIEEGTREEGRWPCGNFAAKNKNYQQYLDAHRFALWTCQRSGLFEPNMDNRNETTRCPSSQNGR